jgi:hypothetical protein
MVVLLESPANYTEAKKRSGELEASPYFLKLYPLQPPLDYVKRPKTLVASEGYHNQHSCE